MNIETPITANIAFDPLEFFSGIVEASGMVVDFRGRITRSFTARFDGERTGDAIRIREVLHYNDGAKDVRLWHITPISEGVWSAAAEGLDPPAIIRRDIAHPARNRWAYTMRVPVQGRMIRFAFEDIMTQTGPDNMVAITTMKKFGLTLAHLSSEYRRIG
jgi:hypothetical protein